jgi:type VI secretion system protein ImpH
VRLLERYQPERDPIGRYRQPRNEVVRLGAYPSMAFPASQIQQLHWQDKEQQPFMVVNFMGLTGPLGVLPLYYTTLVIGRGRERDRTMRDFFDLFNHRMISLFYQAWEKYRFPIAYERGGLDKVSRNLLDLIGLGTNGLQKRQGVRDEVLLYYGGIFSQRPRSAIGLEQVLSDYFEVPAKVQQFVGSWYRIDAETQCKLFESGFDPSRQLGVGAIVGDEIYDQQSKVRIRLGPLSMKMYRDFLPTGTAYQPLRSLVRFWAGDTFDFEVQLILDRKEVPACELGDAEANPPQLGWVSWVRNRVQDRDPGETILRL